MNTYEKAGIIAGGGLVVAIGLVALRSGGSTPALGSTPKTAASPTPTPTPKPTTFHNCWAYHTSDTGRGYVLDNLGLAHYVRDACAWYQAGYPWPISSAASCTQAQLEAYAAVHGYGSDVCNNDDSGCPNPPDTFGCGYRPRCGFQCISGGTAGGCPNPEVQTDGTHVYSLCSSNNFQPLPGGPCTCGDGFYPVGGTGDPACSGTAMLARGMVESPLGSRV